VTGEVHPLDWQIGSLLAAGKEIPRQPEVARRRALLRARVALAGRSVVRSDSSARTGSWRWRVYMVLAASLAFMVGATGAAFLLRGSEAAAHEAATVEARSAGR
jgi:hypothetical protein